MSFWLSLPLAGLFAAAVAVVIGVPILRLRGVYFAMISLVLTQVVTLTALALPITNGAQGYHLDPAARRGVGSGPDPDPGFRDAGKPKACLLLRRQRADGADLCRHVSAGEFAAWPSVSVDAAERGVGQFQSASTSRTSGSSCSRSRPFWAVLAGRCSAQSHSRFTLPAFRSPTA